MLQVDVTKDAWDYIAIIFGAVASSATVLTVLFAANELRMGRRREQAAREEAQRLHWQERISRRGAQARSIGHYVRDPGRGGDPVELVVVNASSLPITQLKAEVAPPWQFEGGASELQLRDGALDAGATRVIELRVESSDAAPAQEHPRFSVVFRDNAGRFWRRDPSNDVQWAPGGRPLDGD